MRQLIAIVVLPAAPLCGLAAHCDSVRDESGASHIQCNNASGGGGIDRRADGDARRDHHGSIQQRSYHGHTETFGGIQSYTERPGYPAPRIAPGDTYIRRGNQVFRIHHDPQ